ncbi:MAG TPA: NAD(P)-binding protein [Burkholderiaceae bacterium]|nr:NAD(P)-binding protein [Burkholderiaceae bacterium]
MTPSAPTELFRSYWVAGYEGADNINGAGEPLLISDSTQHIQRAQEDYALLRDFGIRTVRENVGWHLVETDGQFDFSTLESRARAAREMGLQIVWTLCHHGWPPDIDVYSPEFIERFARYCRSVTCYLARFSDEAPVYSLINEISFTCWAAAENRFPSANFPAQGGGSALKRQLVRATLAGCDAIWEFNSRARIMHCDPAVHVVAPANRPELQDAAAAIRQSQFEAWDMLSGRLEPELGGAPRYLDLIGVDYYHDNQWEIETNETLDWHLDDPRRCPLHRLLIEVYQRYQRPILLSETSHAGSGRGVWIREIAQEIALAKSHDVDLIGVCLYPIIDRPDWQHARHWHYSGLWDVRKDGDEKFRRILSQPYAAALRQAQRLTGQFCPSYMPSERQGDRMPAIIVFSHLRWDFVCQRPQHLMSRLAEYYPVVFVEEPIFDEQESRWEISNPVPNVFVCQPHTSIAMPGFHDDQLPQLRKLMRQLVADYDDHIVWFYTPMALPLLQELHPRLVVYDCMDELAAFKNAPKQLLQRENAVLKVADVVFTGGPSLYRAKRERHPNVHCFPSSVDGVHFVQALDHTNSHPAHRDIPGPRLGYYGVIDERFDTELIGQVADAHPQWQIVLVGPVVKIDPAVLPQRPNIHYLGQQPYKALPHFLAGWDVCLLPFALNESTRFISPTKTLEYMAAELPIVSTPVTDVADLYKDIVYIAADVAQFIASCEAALLETTELRARKVKKMRAVVASTSWDSTAEKMHALMEAARNVQKPEIRQIPEPAEASSNINPLRKQTANVKCAIIGAGPTGLSAAYHLDKDTLLLDKNSTIGGWCRSVEDKGFTFDYAGHIMFSNDAYVQKLYQILLGDNVHWQNREAWIYSKGVHTRYPFQGALYGLPPKVIKECIVGAMEARYGSLKKPDTKSDAANNGGAVVCKEITDCCADGTVTLPATSPSARALPLEKPLPDNFEEFIYKVWGSGIAKHFAIPYNRKLWTVPLTDMETSWLGGRVPLPDIEEIIEGALEPVGKPMGPNARFGYPLRGGFQALVSGFLPHIKGTVELNADVVQVSPGERIVALADGRRFHYDSLISTMPLPQLVKLIGDEAPAEVKEAARGLQHISVRCVNLGVAREKITDKHWIYYPEDTIFHRIFVQGNASPNCNPPGGFGLTCEISYSPWKPLPVDGQRLIDRCVADCIKVGLMNADDQLITANQVDMSYAYVVYDHARSTNVATIKAWLAEHDIVLSGRYSEWEYYNSDHAFLAGKKAAETVKWLQPQKSAVAE